MLKTIIILLSVTALLLLVLGIYFRQEIARFRYQTSLFSGAVQAENFVRQADFYPVNRMTRSDQPFRFPHRTDATPQTLPSTFTHDGKPIETDLFLRQTDTGALLILKNGEIVYENYWLTGGETVQWLCHSVSKTFVSAAIGLAVRDGLIRSINDPITDYLPSLKDSGYQDVPIKDILQMSSGVRWNEAYADRNSDINRFGRTLLTGSSYDDFVATLVAENQPGTFNRYTGMDTQALTMLVRSVSGTSLAAFLEEKLWHPLGMEHDAYWTTDNQGVELGLGGLNATARDFAKLGEFYRKQGLWQGNQILPADWIAASVTPDAPHLERGQNGLSSHAMGYGYQWWLPDGDPQDFSAIGIYNQFIYVNPAHTTVIVKLSANRNYAKDKSPQSYREKETFSLFRAIAAGNTATSEPDGQANSTQID